MPASSSLALVVIHTATTFTQLVVTSPLLSRDLGLRHYKYICVELSTGYLVTLSRKASVISLLWLSPR